MFGKAALPLPAVEAPGPEHQHRGILEKSLINIFSSFGHPQQLLFQWQNCETNRSFKTVDVYQIQNHFLAIVRFPHYRDPDLIAFLLKLFNSKNVLE